MACLQTASAEKGRAVCSSPCQMQPLLALWPPCTEARGRDKVWSSCCSFTETPNCRLLVSPSGGQDPVMMQIQKVGPSFQPLWLIWMGQPLQTVLRLEE